MAFDTAIQKVVKKLVQIQGIGVSVTYRKVATGTYNSKAGTVSESLTDTSVKAIFSDVKTNETNTLVQFDDRKCTIAADSLDFTPSTADRIVYSSIQYQIVKVKTIDQAGTPISYELILRA